VMESVSAFCCAHRMQVADKNAPIKLERAIIRLNLLDRFPQHKPLQRFAAHGGD
jgi:hypothetical protein